MGYYHKQDADSCYVLSTKLGICWGEEQGFLQGNGELLWGYLGLLWQKAIVFNKMH